MDEPTVILEPTIEAVRLTLQGDVGGKQISFEVLLDASLNEKAMDERLDLYIGRFERQKARTTIRMLVGDVAQAELAIAIQPQKIREMLGNRAADRARLQASFVAAHEASNRRGDFRFNQQQRVRLDEHDAETRAKEAEMASELEKNKARIEFLKSEIVRFRRQVAGLDPADVEVEEEPLPQAAE